MKTGIGDTKRKQTLLLPYGSRHRYISFYAPSWRKLPLSLPLPSPFRVHRYSRSSCSTPSDPRYPPNHWRCEKFQTTKHVARPLHRLEHSHTRKGSIESREYVVHKNRDSQSKLNRDSHQPHILNETKAWYVLSYPMVGWAKYQPIRRFAKHGGSIN